MNIIQVGSKDSNSTRNNGNGFSSFLAQNPTKILQANISFFVKLDHNNFLVCKEQLIIMMCAYGMTKYIDGTQEEPSYFLKDSLKVNS